jgi:cytochrome P450
MRLPVARSTTAALLPWADLDTRNHVAGLVLDWVDSLGPIISAARSPRRWSRPRRAERASRTALADALAGLTADPSALAPALAAGVQVPVAAGAWCLTQLASRTDLQHAIRVDSGLALPFVWEILRLWPPSWLLPRITSRECLVGETRLPADAAVLVSPFALGRLPDLIPGPVDGHAPVDQIDPTRWAGGGTRPGSWLPFGAGPHACPGRNLALAQLVHLVSWATTYDLVSPAAPSVNTDRGLSPDPSHIRISRRQPGDVPRA